MPKDVGNIELFMGPKALNNRDDLEAAIIAFIGDAKESLDIAVQELESEAIAQAIIDVKKQGIKIRLVLEGHYLTVDNAVVDPWVAGGNNEANRRIHSALLRSKIEVRTDLNPKTFHQKFIVRDPDGNRAALLTGSTNFTPTGTGSNLNHVVLVKGKSVAGTYLDEFEEIWSGTFGRVSVRHDPKPRLHRASKVRIKVLFAPDHAPELEIMKQMLKARERIDFAIFTFASSSGIDDTMLALHPGIAIRGVLDGGQGGRPWAPTQTLQDAGIEIHLARRVHGLNKLHHKLMVIDRQVLVVGSFNFTEPANTLNDENILVIGDLNEDDPEAKERQSQLAEYALSEIDDIIDTYAG